MKYEKSIIWFRNNLRLKDNPCLAEGIQKSKSYLLLYVFDEDHWNENPLGMRRSGDRKLNFIMESLESLESAIQELGGQFQIVKGKPDEVIEEIAKEEDVDAVFAPKESGSYERKQQEHLAERLIESQITLELFHQHTLFHEDDIPWPINKLPDVFTQFRKENEKETDIRELYEEPSDLRASLKLSSNILENRDSLSIHKPEVDNRGVLDFTGGEQAAWDRLNKYFYEDDLLHKYKFTRNGLIGADYSSKFSPWLAHGCISPRSIYYEVKKYEKEVKKNVSTYWLIFELIWRDYFHFILKKYDNKLFQLNGIKDDEFDWRWNEKDFYRWVNGETGVPFIDANMRELNATGYMSNRGRQLVASVLAKDLKLDWRMGAWYFEHALIDHDVASNWGNWAYNAGVGNDPRDRSFNILSQAKKYDKKGEYIRLWVEELEEVEGFNAHKISLVDDVEVRQKLKNGRVDYLHPMINMKKWDY